MKNLLFSLTSALLLATSLVAADESPATRASNIIRLYEGKAPGSESWTHSEKESLQNMWNTRIAYNVSDPTLTVFRPEPGKANGT